MSGFVHLRVRSEYSLVDSTVRIDALMERAAAAGIPAVGVTDAGNLFAVVKAVAEAERRGVKPIVGVDLQVLGAEAEPTRLTLLCMDLKGYRDLAALVTRSYREGQRRGVPLVRREWIAEHASRLIALSGGGEGDVGRALLADRADQARALLDGWRALFGERYCLEVWRTGRRDDEPHLAAAAALASASGTPLVATNDVRFLSPDDFQAHEARVCIHEGRTLDDPRRPRRFSAQQYLRTPEEMRQLFADLPEALDNAVEVARRCNLELELGKSHLPQYPLAEGRTAAQELTEQAEAGLAARLADDPLSPDPAPYRARLATEIVTIADMGFAGYYLIVADFTRWARTHGVPVGPGRGSGAGSLAAYALGITDLDPIRYELLFERFLNPERVSLPDFDIDFCVAGRDRVIDYVAQRYGRDRVSQIITYGSMASRAVVRDVARVLGHPYSFADGIAKLIPVKQGIVFSLKDAIEAEPELKRRYKEEEEVKALIDLARRLEGLARNAGKHAGGVVIAPRPLTEFTALYCEEGGEHVVTQLDMEDCEKVGLVKFDFLGLTTVTIIDRALQIVNARRAERGLPAVDLERVALDDPSTYALLRRAETTAVFQLESRGMKDLLRRLQPDRFDDIIAVNALFRPGPLGSGMVDEFIERKHGKRRVEYPHPDLEPILSATYGVMVYQEQVMQTAQVLAGYTLGGADLLRRAMGKKKAEEMAKQRRTFTEGAAKRGVEARTATHIFDLMEKFAEYGFNKSHAAAYALLAYRTAWLKAHFPAEFMAAVLTLAMSNTDSVVTLIEECRTLGLEVVPPDINRSSFAFTVIGDRTVMYGLGAIRGVGEGAVAALEQERAAAGAFRDLDDLCRRIDHGKLNKRVLEALVKAGACDGLAPNRASALAHLPKSIAGAEQAQRAAATGQHDIFGNPASGASHAPAPAMVALPDLDERTRLAGEKETLGLYLTGHPMDRFADEVPHLASGRIGDLIAEEPPQLEGEDRFKQRGRTMAVVGLVHEVRRRQGRVSLLLDDRSGRIEVTLFEEQAQQFKHLLAEDAVLYVEGRFSYDEFSGAWRIGAKLVKPIAEARARALRRVTVPWPSGAGPESAAKLRSILEPFRGGGVAVALDYGASSGRGEVALPDDWKVQPTDELLDRLRQWSGGKVRMAWGPRNAA